MTGSQIIFYFLGAVAVLSGLGVILSRSAVHSALFLIVALTAAFFPTRRAIAVDPTTALRCE